MIYIWCRHSTYSSHGYSTHITLTDDVHAHAHAYSDKSLALFSSLYHILFGVVWKFTTKYWSILSQRTNNKWKEKRTYSHINIKYILKVVHTSNGDTYRVYSVEIQQIVWCMNYFRQNVQFLIITFFSLG